MKTNVQPPAKPKVLNIDELEVETLYNYDLDGETGVILFAHEAFDGVGRIVELVGRDKGMIWDWDNSCTAPAKFTRFVGKLVLEND